MAAGRRNPEVVNGLEIVKYSDGQLSQLSGDEIKALKRPFRRIGRQDLGGAGPRSLKPLEFGLIKTYDGSVNASLALGHQALRKYPRL